MIKTSSYFRMTLVFHGILNGKRKLTRHSIPIPHDIPLTENKHYHPKSLFIGTVVDNFLKENVKELHSQVLVNLSYSEDFDNGLTTCYPFNELTHSFIVDDVRIDERKKA